MIDAGTLLLTLVCLVVVFAPVLVEARRLLGYLPRRDGESPPLAPDAEVEDAVVRRLYGQRTRTESSCSAAGEGLVTVRRLDRPSTARTHHSTPRTHAPGRASEHRTSEHRARGSETRSRVPRRRPLPRR